MDQIGRVLARSQKETFAKILGEPFDFSRLKREPPRRGSAVVGSTAQAKPAS